MAKSKIRDDVYDWWLPLAWFVLAPAAFLLFAFDTPLVAIVALGVFFLGLVPQAKMKRAELLTQLQQRFNELAGDSEALTGTKKGGSGCAFDQEAEAKAFYLKFWGLQQLEFSLWRYGMIPSDSYAHWVIRRILSFRSVSTEKYWGKSPKDGWTLVREEFVGTDFRCFVEAAETVGGECEKDVRSDANDRSEWTEQEFKKAYADLLPKIERLLVVSGGSSLLIRWLQPRRRDLTAIDVAGLRTKANTKLLRERCGNGKGLLIVGTVLLIIGLGIIGKFTRPLLQTSAQRVIVLGEQAGGVIVRGSDQGPLVTFEIEFPEEGTCLPGRVLRGHSLSRNGRRHVQRIAWRLKACGGGSGLDIEVVGFASSSRFQRPTSCGFTTSDEANLELANARARHVAQILRESLGQKAVRHEPWSAYEDMDEQRSFNDILRSGVYSLVRGSLNRTAEIRVLRAGDCERVE